MVETLNWHVRGNGLNFVVMNQNLHTVAECASEADAHLIAAAPKLFCALQTLIRRGYRIEVSDYESALDALKDASVRYICPYCGQDTGGGPCYPCIDKARIA